MAELPATWASVELGVLIQRIEAGLNITCEERPPVSGERGLVKISAVTWGKFDERASKTFLPGAVVDERNRIYPGDLLISRANTIELVGAAVIVDRVERALYLSDKVLRLVVSESSKRWINYALKSPALRKDIQDASSGNQLSMRNLSQDRLRGLRLPLAPLAEQQRIADKLDAVVARVDACRDRMARVTPLLKRFRQSVLVAATSGKLTQDWRQKCASTDEFVDSSQAELPTGWRHTTFADVCSEITVGFVGKMSSEYVDSGVPFLRSMNVREFRFDAKGLKFITPAFHRVIQKSALRSGDLAIVRSGAPGTCCVVPPELDGANCSDLVIARPGRDLVSGFGCILINSSFGASHVAATQVGVAQAHFNVGSMKLMPCPLPPVEEQAEIVRRVEALFAFADRLEARLAKAQAAADRLTPALLAKAFRGELVPQDPADEPAAVLLQRLAASRSAPAAKTRRPRVSQFS